jgi:hypothetical protein
MADKPAEKPVDLTHDEIKAREQMVADDLAKRGAKSEPKEPPTLKPPTQPTA